jgi:hypothetical protein
MHLNALCAMQDMISSQSLAAHVKKKCNSNFYTTRIAQELNRRPEEAPRLAPQEHIALVNDQAHLPQLITILHLHSSRAVHGLLINHEPTLRLLHHFPLLVLFMLALHVDAVHILPLRLFI